MSMTFKTEGFAELDQVLGTLSKASARAASRRALTDAAEPMAAAARRNAPRDDDQLYENIDISPRAKGADGRAAFAQALAGGASRSAARAASRAASGGSFVQVYLGPTTKAPHAHFQEFGTVHHPPEPYLRPAFDAEAKPTIRRLGVTLADEIGKAAARAARRAARG